MRILIENKKFLSILESVCPIAEKIHTLPIFGNVLLDAESDRISLVGTDKDIYIRKEIEHSVEDSGKTTISGKNIFDICKSVPRDAELSLVLDGSNFLVKSAGSKFSLVTLPPEDFPIADSHENKFAITVQKQSFMSLIESTVFAMAQQDARFFLNGLLLEIEGKTIRTVATDGHRLALRENILERESENNQKVIIPRKAVFELRRLLSGNDEEEINIGFGQNHIQVNQGKTCFTSMLIDGNFPEYKMVIPDSEHLSKVEINREIFRDCLTRASIILSSEKYKPIKLTFQKGSLNIYSQKSEQGEAEEDMEISYDGDKIEIGFNVRYLLDVLEALKSDEVFLYVRDQNTSCLLLPGDNSSCKYVIMPVKL